MKRTSLALPAVLAAVALSACGKETQPAAPAGTAGPGKAASASAPAAMPAITTAELDAVTKPAKAYRLALIVKTRNNPFFDPMIKAFEAEAQAMGATFETQAPAQEGDKEVQDGYVRTETAKGVDAILVAPADSKAIIPALRAAQDKGILVINLDNRIDAQAAAQQGLALGGYVGADNEEGGRLAGQAMSEALGGKGSVAIVEGILSADNAQARAKGFEEGAKGLNIVAREPGNWEMDQANAKAAGILASHPDIAGIFCANDMMALGAIKAVKAAGRTGKVTVVGYDNIPAVQPALASGDLYATIEQHPDLMGRYGVKMAVGVLGGSVPKGRQYLVPLEVVRGKPAK